ncbi:FkbM family methyltransferase [Methanomicrobium antiquum]|uniref:FkbM family methyltransferase n=1 Tax=Methanomicrobium antiquum TaxID=487686 RepID=A0AAF0FMC4_9EURY|nr:FkbM family methyltransferase [Methanomicrobium antiquum]WFN37128.1 FkbM family methyltransferase [Methanomicrobium antiquum]
MADEKSLKTLLCILKHRIDGNYTTLHAESDFIFNQYFDKKIIKLSEFEKFVDCGGFIGDTTEMFINHVTNFSKIYFYEPQSDNFNKASTYLSSWEKDVFDKIILRNVGVGKENALLKIKANGANSTISSEKGCEIEVVSLDNDIKEPISFIKMDIEGSELDALNGAKRHIIDEKPKLAICVYHKPNDLWEISELILEMNPSYKLYLRQYKLDDGNNPYESVLYAI